MFGNHTLHVATIRNSVTAQIALDLDRDELALKLKNLIDRRRAWVVRGPHGAYV